MEPAVIDRIEVAGRALVGIVVSLLGLMILLYPGPVALTDRVPFALIILIPGVIVLYQTYLAFQE